MHDKNFVVLNSNPQLKIVTLLKYQIYEKLRCEIFIILHLASLGWFVSLLPYFILGHKCQDNENFLGKYGKNTNLSRLAKCNRIKTTSILFIHSIQYDFVLWKNVSVIEFQFTQKKFFTRGVRVLWFDLIESKKKVTPFNELDWIMLFLSFNWVQVYTTSQSPLWALKADFSGSVEKLVTHALTYFKVFALNIKIFFKISNNPHDRS